MHTMTMRAIMTAYSTEVVASSSRRKSRIGCLIFVENTIVRFVSGPFQPLRNSMVQYPRRCVPLKTLVESASEKVQLGWE